MSHSCTDNLCPSSPSFSPPPLFTSSFSFHLLPPSYPPLLLPSFFTSLFSVLFPLTFLLLPCFLLLFSFHYPSFLSPSIILPFSLLFSTFFYPSITLSSSSLSSTFFFSTVSLFSSTRSSSPQFEPLIKQRSVNTTTKNEVIRKQFFPVCWNQSASGYLEHV